MVCTDSTLRLLRRPIVKAGFVPEEEKVWFMRNVVGKTKVTSTYRDLGEIMKNDEMKAVTAHGGRACFITANTLHGVTSAAIRAQTGHANEQSMAPYKRSSAQAEKILQDVIAGKHRRQRSPSSAKKDSRGGKVGSVERAKADKPESPTKLKHRVAKRAKSNGQNVAVEVEDSDDDISAVFAPMGIKKEGKGEDDVEVSVVGVKKGGKMEVLQRQIDEQRKEAEELKQKINALEHGRAGDGNRGLDVNAALPGMPTHHPYVLHQQYGAMGTMNPYGSQFGMAHTHGYAHPHYPHFGATAPPVPQPFGATVATVPQTMPSQFSSPGHNGADHFRANENGKNTNSDVDENTKKGPSISFNCVVS